MPQPKVAPAARRARRKEGARRRAQASRDRRNAERLALQATAAEVEDLRARLGVADAIVDALVKKHEELRAAGHRDPALPLVDVVRAARTALGPEADAAVRARLSAALSRPAAPVVA
ncbi:hypothetical protein [Methylorubrum zatmanii]|uniref:Uncharacterized protein n=1 Tax=Methylorubrum zatmanii TaxID=29429 RepID=A0ABW1WNY2_9HYPH|nr:hypothetical protein [Methylorubrum zatmanii]MBD8909073.1 hypothetical protein [Methylorubrum zatmanii]